MSKVKELVKFPYPPLEDKDSELYHENDPDYKKLVQIMNRRLTETYKVHSGNIDTFKSKLPSAYHNYNLRPIKNRIYPEDKKFNKVFCIGLHKTGTKSLHHGFQMLGLNSWHAGGYHHKVHCFSDGGFFINFDEFDQLLPNCRYILNTRDVKGWIRSRIGHMIRTRSQIAPWRDRVYDVKRIKLWLVSRKMLYKKIKAYFVGERRKDLLIFDITKGHGFKELCDFLELPNPKEPFPRKNKGRKVRIPQDILDFIDSIDSSEYEFENI